MQQNQESFHYTYSAERQKEIQSIQRKYLPESEDKMERLRRLDASVTRPGTILSLILGILGTLVMGFGMCCVMLWADRLFWVGIVIGIVGIALLSSAYPIYRAITKQARAKATPEILALCEELMK